MTSTQLANGLAENQVALYIKLLIDFSLYLLVLDQRTTQVQSCTYFSL